MKKTRHLVRMVRLDFYFILENSTPSCFPVSKYFYRFFCATCVWMDLDGNGIFFRPSFAFTSTFLLPSTSRLSVLGKDFSIVRQRVINEAATFSVQKKKTFKKTKKLFSHNPIIQQKVVSMEHFFTRPGYNRADNWGHCQLAVIHEQGKG